jgi:hypothetical protein
MSKRKAAPRRSAPEWDVYRIKSSPAAFIGRVTAKDKANAIAAAIEQYAVPARHQKRLLALRRAA